MDAMVRRARMLALAVALGMAAAPLGACFAVGAGAGVAGAIYYTQRGASSLVDADVPTTFGKAQTAFRQMQVTQTGESTEDAGAKRKLTGKSGDLDVTVEMTRKSAKTTQVEVYARRNPVDWDKGFAKDLLSRIVTMP
jgi:uncharacterized protein (DUF58 family)